ncbi:MAG TPA: exodeoxyribonuclease VII large subunit [Candidatus Paceibacterota bacterium]|nr:exodeoxyribonuclease VII large subunit [Candidatus Paceibacterota bacterium]
MANYMPKQSKSQWDFGELFPPEPKVPERKVLSVAELTTQIRRLLEKQVGLIWVTGEVTNLRAQSSGHIYFTLKDVSAQLSCVLFRGETVAHRELLQDGQKLLLQGDVTVYEARGQYQLIVRAVELQGVGALQIAFEKLKQKLAAEGMFAAERKRPLPRFPQRIGLVTSPTGAAIRDVLHVVRRRNPSLEIVLAPCRVQGDGAAREIASAIRSLNEWNRNSLNRSNVESETDATIQPFNHSTPLDLILVTRGGGSLEDLWAFNEEVVARAIFDSAIPVVSAIGHEIDFTISDFVADVRAATPSAAAEIITEGVFSSCDFVADSARRIRQLVGQQMEGKVYELSQLRQRLARAHPRRKFNEWLQRLDDLQASLQRCAKAGTLQQRVELRILSERLLRVRPAQLLRQRRELFEQELQRLHEQIRHQLREREARFKTMETRLRLLGPEQVLARGYSITSDAETGAVLRDAAKAKTGQQLRTRLKSGEIFSQVEQVHPPPPPES